MMMMMQMMMGRSRQYGNGNWVNYKYSQFCNDDNYEKEEVDRFLAFSHNINGSSHINGCKEKTPATAIKLAPFSSSPSTHCSSCPSVLISAAGGLAGGYIEHPVSKLDTLAGVAIKYGVEVADIKRINGLVSDLQMFALRTLQIPLPGRHPPSTSLSNCHDTPGQNGSYQTPPRVHSDFLDSFQSLRLKSSSSPRKVSPAMSSLRGYYGLRPRDPELSEGFEMSVYKKDDSNHPEDNLLHKHTPASNPPLSRHRKSRSLVSGFLDENDGLAENMLGEAEEGDADRWNETLVRRRQKSEADFSAYSNETLIEDNNNSGAFSAITGKGLALRPKAASRTPTPTDVADVGGSTPVPIALGYSLVTDEFSRVRKSSSTSSLQEQDGAGSSIWTASKWNLKPDLQALSAVASARPIFDGLPKPMISRRNKAAID